MKIYLWVLGKDSSHIVLWDGEITYWSEDMIPSGGYKKMRTEMCPITKGQFFYIGEL